MLETEREFKNTLQLHSLVEFVENLSRRSSLGLFWSKFEVNGTAKL